MPHIYPQYSVYGQHGANVESLVSTTVYECMLTNIRPLFASFQVIGLGLISWSLACVAERLAAPGLEIAFVALPQQYLTVFTCKYDHITENTSAYTSGRSRNNCVSRGHFNVYPQGMEFTSPRKKKTEKRHYSHDCIKMQN